MQQGAGVILAYYLHAFTIQPLIYQEETTKKAMITDIFHVVTQQLAKKWKHLVEVILQNPRKKNTHTHTHILLWEASLKTL